MTKKQFDLLSELLKEYGYKQRAAQVNTIPIAKGFLEINHRLKQSVQQHC